MDKIDTTISNKTIYKIIITFLSLIILIIGILYINKEKIISNYKTTNNELSSENKSLNKNKKELLSQIDELNNKINTLEEKIEILTNEEEITKLEKEIKNLKQQITTLKTSINNLEKDKENLTAEITNYKNTINTLNTTIEDLNNKIATLKEEIETYTVFYSVDNKTIYKERVKKGENVKNIPSIPTKGNYKSEWSNDGKNIENDIVIYANYYYLLTFTYYDNIDSTIATLSSTTYKLYEDKTNKTLTINDNNIKIEDETLVEATMINKIYNPSGWYIDNTNYSSGIEYEVTENIELKFDAYTGCIIKGSKISMANGTTKNVENIKIGDEVLSYNYYNGTIDKTKVTTVIKGLSNSKIFNVKLANGNELKIVDDEYLFDTDLKEFIKINIYTYESSIGKNVMINDNGNISSSKIISITYTEKVVEHYTMYTAKTVDYIANNIIALAPVEYTNIRYKIDNNYKVDMNKYNEDITNYGTYNYSDLEDVCTKETFDNFVLKDYKYIIEKGYMTYEEFKQGIKILQEEIDYYNSLN